MRINSESAISAVRQLSDRIFVHESPRILKLRCTVKFFIPLILILISCSGAEKETENIFDPRPLNDAVIAALRDAENTGYIVLDAKSGEVLCEHNCSSRFIPASATKLITLFSSHRVLGSDRRFRTRVMYTGEIVDGSVNGALYLVGGCDPLLTSDDLRQLADKVVKSGIRKITGPCCYDDSMLQDVLKANPLRGLTSLCISYDYSKIEAKRQGVPAKTVPPLAAKEDPPFFLSGDNSGFLTSPPSFVPAKQTALFFFNELARGGVKGGSPSRKRVPADAKELVSIISEPLVMMYPEILFYSINHSSELIYAMTLAQNPQAMRDLPAMSGQPNGQGGSLIVCGSGLSSKNRLSPRLLADVLLQCYITNFSGVSIRTLLDPFGQGYSVRGRLNAEQSAGISAKTGSLAYSLSLCGYADTASGREIIFVIMATDFAMRKSYEAGQIPAIPAAQWQQQHLDDQADFLRLIKLL